MVQAKDPSIYPALIDFFNQFPWDVSNFGGYIEPLRPLPGSMTMPLFEKYWPQALGSAGEYWYLDPASRWGLPATLDRAAELVGGTAQNVNGDRRI